MSMQPKIKTRAFLIALATLLAATLPAAPVEADEINTDGLTRDEMAGVFQALGLTRFEPAACVAGEEMFDDVPASSPYCPWVEELARQGITTGCDDDNFCPTGAASRQQLAVFLVKSLSAVVAEPGPVVFDPRTEVVGTFLELGGPGMSAGNMNIEHSALVDPDTGEGVGRVVTRWQVVEDLGGGDAVVVFDCTVELDEGNLNFYGSTELSRLPSGISLSIIGGTGTYLGVGGTVTITAAEIDGQQGMLMAFELAR